MERGVQYTDLSVLHDRETPGVTPAHEPPFAPWEDVALTPDTLLHHPQQPLQMLAPAYTRSTAKLLPCEISRASTYLQHHTMLNIVYVSKWIVFGRLKSHTGCCCRCAWLTLCVPTNILQIRCAVMH